MTRVALLGASNIARGLAAAVAASERVGPSEILIAAGRGRAYSRASVLLVRGLPSITRCGLWQEIERGDGVDHALVTDLGNDLVYGATVDETVAAVGAVLERLVATGTRPVVTALPLDSLDRFPTVWLDTVRRSFFPASTLSASLLLGRAHRLDEQLRLLCAELDIEPVEQDLDWYGLDPIHHRLRKQSAAFSAMTASWGGTPERPGLGHIGRLALAWPESSDLWGRSLSRAQPSAKLRGGTEIRLF